VTERLGLRWGDVKPRLAVHTKSDAWTLRECSCIKKSYVVTNFRRTGVDTTTAMKIVGHKSEQMHRQYNTIRSEDLHEAAAKRQTYTVTP
jgi:hypothetical protein